MILLDTHVALWLVAAPDRIGVRSRHAMERSEVCYFSAISLAECAIRRMIGRLDVPADLARVLTESGLRALSLLPEHAETIEKFPESRVMIPLTDCFSGRRSSSGAAS